ncbi:MAG: hypothetical protein ACE5O2_03380 [Armatimonadota bacterium]
MLPSLLLALCLPPTLADSQRPPADRVSSLRSVTYYQFGVELEDADIGLLKRHIARAKDVGFNGMWLVVTWKSLSPVALPQPRLNDAAWDRLDAIIVALSKEGFSIIIPLGYFGRGWSPQGIDDQRHAEWILDDSLWNAFEDHVLRFTRRYAHRDNILWMFYTESFQGPIAAYKDLELAEESFRRYCRRTNAEIAHWNQRWGADYASFDDIGMADGRIAKHAARWEDHWRWVCSVLRARYGALTRKMKTDVAVRGLVGFHDNAMITMDWAKGDTPIPDDNPYDYLSFTAYLGKDQAVEDRLEEVAQVHSRFRHRYPDVPLMIGETGVPTLVRDEATQAEYLATIARYAKANSLGINIWMWQDFKGSTEEQRSFGLLRLDGTDKPAVEALRKAFAK